MAVVIQIADLNKMIERAVRSVSAVKALVTDAQDIVVASGLSLDTEHADAAGVLVQFLAFANGQAVAADAQRVAKLSKVRSDTVVSL